MHPTHNQLQVAPLPAPEDEASAVADPEGHWAARMLQRVRSKATPEEIDAWQSEEVCVWCVCVCGGGGGGGHQRLAGSVLLAS